MNIKKAPPQAPKEIYVMIRPLSVSSPGQQHRTVLYTDGSAHCTCEGFRYRETCRHSELIRHWYTVNSDGRGLSVVGQ